MAAPVAENESRDDLSKINGVGQNGEIKLTEYGIHRFTGIPTLSLNDEASLEERMGLSRGAIAE